MLDPDSILSDDMKELEDETRKNTIVEFNNFKLNRKSVLEISSKGRDILFSELTNTVVTPTNQTIIIEKNTIDMIDENTNVMNEEKKGGTKKKRGRKFKKTLKGGNNTTVFKVCKVDAKDKRTGLLDFFIRFQEFTVDKTITDEELNTFTDTGNTGKKPFYMSLTYPKIISEPRIENPTCFGEVRYLREGVVNDFLKQFGPQVSSFKEIVKKIAKQNGAKQNAIPLAILFAKVYILGISNELLSNTDLISLYSNVIPKIPQSGGMIFATIALLCVLASVKATNMETGVVPTAGPRIASETNIKPSLRSILQHGLRTSAAWSEFVNSELVNDALNGFNLDVVNAKGQTALMFACDHNDIDTIKKLVENGANVNIRDDIGNTALHHVVKQSFSMPKVAKFLIDSGANINEKNNDGQTPLDIVMGFDKSISGRLYMSKETKELIELFKKANAIQSPPPPLLKTFANAFAKINEPQSPPLPTVKSLIPLGSNPIMPSYFDSEWGRFINDESVTKGLSENAYNMDVVDKDGNTALMKASNINDLDTAKKLIRNGADPNVQNKDGDTALMLAKNYEIVDVLIMRGCDINHQNINGDTALMIHVQKLNVESVNLLLNAEANIELKNKANQTALEWTSSYSGYSSTAIKAIIQALTEKKIANTLSKELLTKSNDIKFKDSNAVKDLIAKGANINFPDQDGNTALILAASNGNKEIVDELISNTADINRQNNNGDTALITATRKANIRVYNDIAIKIIDSGADVNIQDDDGNTALIIAAATKGNNEIALKLIESGANVNIQGGNGYTALMHASENNNSPLVVSLITTTNVDINIKNKDGKTASLIAIEKGNSDINLELTSMPLQKIEPIKLVSSLSTRDVTIVRTPYSILITLSNGVIYNIYKDNDNANTNVLVPSDFEKKMLVTIVDNNKNEVTCDVNRYTITHLSNDRAFNYYKKEFPTYYSIDVNSKGVFNGEGRFTHYNNGYEFNVMGSWKNGKLCFNCKTVMMYINANDKIGYKNRRLIFYKDGRAEYAALSFQTGEVIATEFNYKENTNNQTITFTPSESTNPDIFKEMQIIFPSLPNNVSSSIYSIPKIDSSNDMKNALQMVEDLKSLNEDVKQKILDSDDFSTIILNNKLKSFNPNFEQMGEYGEIFKGNFTENNVFEGYIKFPDNIIFNGVAIFNNYNKSTKNLDVKLRGKLTFASIPDPAWTDQSIQPSLNNNLTIDSSFKYVRYGTNMLKGSYLIPVLDGNSSITVTLPNDIIISIRDYVVSFGTTLIFDIRCISIIIIVLAFLTIKLFLRRPPPPPPPPPPPARQPAAPPSGLLSTQQLNDLASELVRENPPPAGQPTAPPPSGLLSKQQLSDLGREFLSSNYSSSSQDTPPPPNVSKKTINKLFADVNTLKNETVRLPIFQLLLELNNNTLIGDGIDKISSLIKVYLNACNGVEQTQIPNTIEIIEALVRNIYMFSDGNNIETLGWEIVEDEIRQNLSNFITVLNGCSGQGINANSRQPSNSKKQKRKGGLARKTTKRSSRK